MPAPMSTHPTVQALQSFAAGQLEPARAKPLRAHLDSCAACTAKVNELSAERGGFRKTASASEAQFRDAPSRRLVNRARDQGAIRRKSGFTSLAR